MIRFCLAAGLRDVAICLLDGREVKRGRPQWWVLTCLIVRWRWIFFWYDRYWRHGGSQFLEFWWFCLFSFYVLFFFLVLVLMRSAQQMEFECAKTSYQLNTAFVFIFKTLRLFIESMIQEAISMLKVGKGLLLVLHQLHRSNKFNVRPFFCRGLQTRACDH